MLADQSDPLVRSRPPQTGEVDVVKERLAMFALGLWLAGTIFVSVVAAQNFYTIDRLLAESPNAIFMKLVERIGRSESRDMLRYLSSELNRLYFQLWNATQFAIGVLVIWLLAANRSASKARWGVIAMLGLVVFMIVWLTPQIISLGRGLDFVPRDPAPPSLGRFGMFHGLYLILEALKLAIGAVVVYWIALSRPERAAGDLAP
jgi:hypothetical protein